MSVWYDIKCYVYGDRESIAKFFNLEIEDVFVDNFEIEYGRKNMPGLGLVRLIEKNPGLIFLVRESVECDTVIWSLHRYDEASKEIKGIMIQNSGSASHEVNAKFLEMYMTKFPGLAEKHEDKQKGFEGYRWTYLLNSFDKMNNLLKNADQYRKMVCPMMDANLEFDNQPFV